MCIEKRRNALGFVHCVAGDEAFKLSDKYFPAARWTSEITVQAMES